MNPRPAIKHDGVPAHLPHYIGGVPLRKVNFHLYCEPGDEIHTERFKCSNCKVLPQFAYGEHCSSCARQYGVISVPERFDIGRATVEDKGMVLRCEPLTAIPDGLYRVVLERA